ncbi:hypothetical protein [Corynebacterium flavescens]|uniref:hypothetical protein n=1 Tax=Corynebacterium flavescens TaxID=28028 RepID=UPI003FD58ED1
MLGVSETGQNPAAAAAAAAQERGWFVAARGRGAVRFSGREWAAALVVVAVGTFVRVLVLGVLARANGESLAGLLGKWDARYYTEIARVGYFHADIPTDGPVYENSLAMFPGYPLVIRAFSFLGLPEAQVGMTLNFFFTVVLAAGVMALAARMGAGFAARIAAAVVVTSAPMSIVFTMPYTEALFGALLIWALVALSDKNWFLAAVLIFGLSFVRLTAIDAVLCFAVMVAFNAPRQWKAWAGVVSSALPLVAYLAWSSHYLGEVGGYFGMQNKHWHSAFDFGAATVAWVASVLGTSDNAGYLLSAVVIVGAPVLVVLAWRRLPAPAWVFSAALVANILLSDGIMHSRPRLLLPAAVLFIPWVLWLCARVRPPVAWGLLACWVLAGAWFSAHMLAVFEWAI